MVVVCFDSHDICRFIIYTNPYFTGLSPGESDIRNYTNVGLRNFVVAYDLELTAGTTYYISVSGKEVVSQLHSLK